MDELVGTGSSSRDEGPAALSSAKAALLERWRKGKPAGAARGGIVPGGPPGPLSFAQQRLWFLHRLAPTSPAYSMFVARRLLGGVDEAALDRALAHVVRRHQVLRTVYPTGADGRPAQVVQPAPASLLRVLDVPSPDALSRALDEEARTPVDLERGPVLRAHLYRLGPEERLLLVTIHHVAFDEWSEGLFDRELSRLYAAEAEGRPCPLPDPEVQYADYARWQRAQAESPATARGLDAWRARLTGLAPLELPTDHPRPPEVTFRGRTLPFRLDAATSDAVRALARAQGVTPFMLLLAAFQVLLHRHSGQEDVAVASPISGRTRPETEGLLGFFVNTLPLRADLSGDPIFAEALARVRESCVAAYADAEVPFERLVEALQPERDPSRAPLVQAFFAYQNAVTEGLDLPGVRVEHEWVFSPTSKWDVSLFVLDDAAGMRCWLEHSTDLWDEATGERLAGRFRTLVAGIVRDPTARIGDLPLVPEDERRLLDAWNRTAAEYPRDACVHRLVEAQARRTPHRFAVACGDERATYEALEARVRRVASRLRAHGAGPGMLVGLLAHRSVDMLAAALAILRAGAAYVPIDPSFPRDRVEHMLRDSGASILLTQRALADALPSTDARVLLLDEDDDAGADVDPDGGATADDLAYVIYTSGSTGTPKGTQITHRALTNFLWDMRERLGLREDDRWLAVTTLSFDIAALELYLPLLVGATVEIAPRDATRDPTLLLDGIRRASVMQATPSTWRMLLDAGWPKDARLRLALSGGEALPLPVARALLERADEAWNLYGPTETTIWSTAHRLDARDERVPIGRPIANTRAHVVDARMRPVPVGVPGELLLAGDGLARGYHARPDLTAERFVTWEGERVYRTGDRARWRGDGTLEHLGRLDRQVKVRGHRVELGEVEAALLAHVPQAAVVLHNDALVAYVVPPPDAPSDAAPDAVVEAWRPVFDARGEAAAPDPTFDTGVWTSSHTGLPFPRETMEEWVQSTVDRILALRPRRVLEIGCGTGLLLWRVAPRCEAYVGTDFSAPTLARLRSELERRGAAANVRLLEREATDFTGVEGTFDLVVLNSVAQYFPDDAYLARVLQEAAARVPTGVVFVGDVRSLPLQRAFHASVERARAGHDLAPDELERRVDARVAEEPELLLHPAFFEDLKRHIPHLRRVRVLPRAGRDRNEMNCYRYDVVLHVGDAPEPVAVESWTPWSGLDALRTALAARPAALGVAGIPNARVNARGDAVEPDEVVALARACGYAAEPSLAAGRTDGSFDAVFAPGPDPVVADFPPAPAPPARATEPRRTRARRENRRALVPRLRERLAERLPEAMVPSTFVVLDALPLTPNGKVDRRALPAPDARQAEPEDHVPPRTPQEEALARVWANLLGVPRVGARDDFFKLGGHSLLAAQMVARARDALGVDLPLRAVFATPTLEALARAALPPRAPVEPLADRQALPLSPAQERLWFLHQLDPASAAYNVASALRLRGPLRLDALRRALDAAAARHDALRTVVDATGGRPVQRILPPAPVPLDVVGARDEAEMRRFVADAAHAPFDLARGPLFRATLVRLAPDHHVLLLAAHHLVFDEWSQRVLLRDLAALYEGRALPPPRLQQGDLVAWQARHDEAAHLSWWRERLADLEPAEVPLDRPRPPVQSFHGQSVSFRLPASPLRALARASDATLFMTTVAACQALLRRHGGSDDIVLGAPVALRDAPGAEDVVGFFVNLLPLRTDLSGDPTFREAVARAKRTCLEAYARQDAPFERVARDTGHAGDLSRTPLFQAALVMEDAATPEPLGDLRTERVRIESRIAKFDLTFWAADEGEDLAFTLEWNADLFEAATAERLARDLDLLLRSAAASPDAPLSRLPLADPAPAAWSGAARPYPRDRCVHELFAEVAARVPDRVALSSGDERVTYRELDARADALAARLRARGVGPDVHVAVALERSVEAVVSLLATLKAGGAYLPLDPAHPDERLAFVLRDAAPAVLLTRRAAAPRFARMHPVVVPVDEEEDAPPPAPRVTPDALAYVMYTSGSTGTPKGVMVPHRAIVRLVTAQEYVRFGPDEVLLQYAPLAFDAATFEIWGALLHGARLALAPPRALSPHELGDVLRREGVTTLWLTAPLFHVMVDENVEGLRGVRQLLAGGDALSPPHVRRALDALPGLRLVNGYGPTESTTFACCHVVAAPPSGRVPIGRPLANTRALVLDARMAPVPVGAPGELWLGGDGLALGYLGRDALTRERFVLRDGERLYRTGDVVRWLPDGTLDFLGRLDAQVKIRGHRVEPAEVESALAAHPDVAEASVVARQDAGRERRLVAYVVPRRGRALDAEALRAHVRRRLPDAFVPAAVVPLDALPLTPNGKVDRRALPPPTDDAAAAHAPPEGPVEEALASIFAQALGVPRVGAEDDFFARGGDSLLATRVVARVRQAFDVDVPLPALFEAPTLRALARVVEERRAAPRLPPVERGPSGDAPLSFGQQRLWFLQQWHPESAAYNTPGAFRLRGALDVAALGNALDAIVRRHDVLRTVYPAVDGEPVQRALPHEPLPLEVVPVVDEAEARRLADELAARPFDLARERPLRARLLRLSNDDHVLLLAFHHIAFDGWSVGILFRELGEAYAATVERRAPRLAEPPVRYADHARWQRRVLHDLAPQLERRRRSLEGLRPLDLPTDRPRPAALSTRGSRVPVALHERLMRGVDALARREGATPFMVLLAAWTTLLHRHSGQDDVAVGAPVSGRRAPEVQGLVGFFVNTLVLRADLAGDPSFREALARVRRACLDAYADQDVPFERLVEELQPARDPSRPPLVQSLFALQEPTPRALANLDVEEIPCETGAAKLELSLSLATDGRGELEYNADLFEPGTAARMAARFSTLLEGALAEPDAPLSRLPLMPPEERDLVLGAWSGTDGDFPRDRLMHELFEAHADRAPDALAIEAPGERLTYAELEARANRLAQRLRREGAGPETIVGLHLERSVDAYVALLGILKAGAAYLPLDPAYPPARLARVMEDVGARLVVTRSDLTPRLPETPARVVLVDDPTLAREPATRPRSGAGPENLAYVIHTSGSTGTPKGVMVEHRGVANLVASSAPRVGTGPGTRLLQMVPLGFDASVAELAASLLDGGALLLPRSGPLLGDALVAELRERRATALVSTPSALRTASPRDLPDLRVVLCGGEACPPDVAAAWGAGRRFVNAYGPTEATCTVTMHERRADERGPLPLGLPLPNVRAYVVDARLQPVPVGVPGELLVGGVGVARGYLGQPDATAARFLPDPFRPGKDARVYRTGDVVRRRGDGLLEFLGRADDQVKVRGHRVELGEVEAALRALPGVRDAAAAAQDDRLVAFLVGGDVASARDLLAATLPPHMVPSLVVPLDALPLTRHGKLDRRALPRADAARVETEGHVAPRTPTETALAAIWRDLLGVPRVGAHDGFFALGGHSLLVPRLVSRVRSDLSVELPLGAVFESPTLDALARRIEASEKARAPSAIRRVDRARYQVKEDDS